MYSNTAIFTGKYVGTWANGERYGRGTMTWKDGREYIGDWRAGKQEGRGEMIWPGGVAYEGGWKADSMHGEGVLKNAPFGEKFLIQYRGSFYEGKMQGRGDAAVVVVGSGKEAFRYNGRFVNDVMEDDQGEVIFPNGDSYKGGVRNNKLNGRGVCSLSSGRKTECFFKDDKPVSSRELSI